MQGFPKEAANKLIQINKDCNCKITITGGTETGHLSHGPGDSIVDLTYGDTASDYILKNRNAYDIKRILCPKFAEPKAGCDGYEINTAPHLHIKF